MGRGKPRAGTEISEVERLEQATAAARQVIAEAREIHRDLRDTMDKTRRMIETEIQNHLENAVKDELRQGIGFIEQVVRDNRVIAVKKFHALTDALEDILKVSLLTAITVTKEEVKSSGETLIDVHRHAVQKAIEHSGLDTNEVVYALEKEITKRGLKNSGS